MGIEPTHQLVTGALVLKTRRPTRRLGTSDCSYIFTQKGFVCKKPLSPASVSYLVSEEKIGYLP